ncbi:MAG: D-alanyl-D-alanine carboxypeptidase [Acidobacteria bacterium]|nr:D-alanyl-D-alanine carboxypeptidase [Acidobacteriota bacterium]
MLQFARPRPLRAVLLFALSLGFVASPAASLVEAKATRASRATRATPQKTVSTASRTTKRTLKTKAATRRAKPAKTTPRYSASKARQRRLAMARARQAAYARQLKEIQTPQFKADADGQLVPDIRAGAAIVYNPTTHEVLYESNAQTPRSIASITKVMTAVAFLENEIDLTREVVVHAEDVRAASTTYLRRGDRVTVNQLLHLLLIGSDNVAARTLARASLYGPIGFIERMNQKAAELGLTRTRYADPSGLYADNMSSAFDMARLISFASGDERLATIMRMKEYEFSSPRRTVTLHNTNHLVGSDVDVRGGKTGFISKSGYCLATLLRLPQGDQVAVVVLGAKSNPARFWETRHLFNWLASKTPSLLATQASDQQE